MDNLEYLNQISTAQTNNRSEEKFLNIPLKILIPGLVVAVVLSLILIIVGSLGSGEDQVEELIARINQRTENLMEVIDDYNSVVKDSGLRAIGSSANTVLLQMSVSLAPEEENEKVVEAAAEEETAHLEELTTTLENARLNGHLDRYYAREMGYEMRLLLALMSEVDARTEDVKLAASLEAEMANVESLAERFEAWYTGD